MKTGNIEIITMSFLGIAAIVIGLKFPPKEPICTSYKEWWARYSFVDENLHTTNINEARQLAGGREIYTKDVWNCD